MERTGEKERARKRKRTEKEVAEKKKLEEEKGGKEGRGGVGGGRKRGRVTEREDEREGPLLTPPSIQDGVGSGSPRH